VTEVLSWFLVLEVITVISFPLAFVFLGRLPDRGYSFAKMLGLLLMGFLLFTGATLGFFPNGRGAVILILAAMAVLGAVIAARRRDELREFLSERWGYALVIEGLFLLSFVVAAYLRSYVPDLTGTEKPSEFAFLNAVLRSDNFPAYDPWLTPFDLSYYYFGFVIFGGLITLTGVPPEVGFNVAVALVTALTVLAAFGLVYNLVAAVSTVRRALAFGAVGVLLVTLLGNIEGLFELMVAHDIGPSSLYTWIGIEGLTLQDAGGTSKWFPDKAFYWWRSTRIPSSWDIKEYPFFSFLLGDLHPHVMVMPFTLLGMAMAYNLLRLAERLDYRWALANWGPFLLAAIVLGGLSFLNAWTFPAVLALVAVVVFARNRRVCGGDWREALKDTATFVVPLAVVAVLLYLPFYLSARGSVWPLEAVKASKTEFLPVYHTVTHPKHLFFSWGALLWLGTGLGVAALGWAWLRKLGRRVALALLPVLVPVVVWALWVTAGEGVSGFFDELDARGPALLTLVLVGGVVVLLLLAFAKTLEEGLEGNESTLFALAAFALGALLILGTELFYINDHVAGPSRENTVFKIWHHTWLFFGAAGAFAVYYVWMRVREGSFTLAVRLPQLAWGAVAVALVAASLVLPVTATFNRTNDFTGTRTLDGLAFLRNFDANEYNAVRWLRDDAEGAPVILEASDNPFTQGGRFSSRTGLPTIIQWPQHEEGYRGKDAVPMIQERSRDVEAAYNTTSVEEAQTIFDKYGVQYAIVGNFEREKYAPDGLAKFGQFMEVAYQNDDVTIYRTLEPGTALVSSPADGGASGP
jgi:YYY domain-containing protein